MSYTQKKQRTTIKLVLLMASLLSQGLSAQESNTILPDVVVTPDKNQTTLSITPATTYVITRQDIEKQAANSVPAILRNVPGLDVVALGSPGDDVDIRLRGADRDEVLILMDGIPINSVREHRTLFLGNLTVDNVERIEVVKGSQSVLYGSDAVGGVINIITRKGSARITPIFGFTAGNLGLFDKKAGISGSAGKALWNFTASDKDQKGRFDRDRFRGQMTSANFSYQLFPQLKTEAGVNYAHSNQEIFYEVLTRFDAGTSSLVIQLDRDNNRTLARDLLEAHNTWETQPFSWWKSTLQYGFFGDWDRGFNSSTGDTVPTGYTAGNQDFDGHGYRHHVDFRNNLDWPALRWMKTASTLGFEFEDERVGFTDIGSEFPASGQEGDRQNEAPYFLQTFNLFEDRLILSGGARFDHNSTFGSEWSPRGSLLYRHSQTGTTFRANYSEGFHGPTILEFYTQTLLRDLGNPAFQAVRLEAERSQSYEAGVEQDLFGRVKIGSTFFYVDYDQLFDELQFIHDAYTTGVETSVIASPWDNLQVGGAYTFMKSINEDNNNRLSNRPQDRFHFFVQATPWERFQVRTDLNIIGHRLIPNTLSTASGDFNLIIVDADGNPSGGTLTNSTTEEGRKLAGYAKLDLSVSYMIAKNQWGLSDWKFFGVIENLLDDQYQEKFGLPAPGINFRLGSEARF